MRCALDMILSLDPEVYPLVLKAVDRYVHGCAMLAPLAGLVYPRHYLVVRLAAGHPYNVVKSTVLGTWHRSSY